MANLLPPPLPLVIAGASRALTDDALSALMHATFHTSHARSATHGAVLPPPPPTLFSVAAAAAAAAATTPPAADDARVPIPSSRSRSRARNRAPAPTPSAARLHSDPHDSDADDSALSAPAAAATHSSAAAAVTVKAEPAAERPTTPTEEQIDALEAEEIHTLGEIERARKRVAIKSRQHADIRARLASARKLFAQRQREQRMERVRQLVEEKRMMGRQHSDGQE